MQHLTLLLSALFLAVLAALPAAAFPDLTKACGKNAQVTKNTSFVYDSKTIWVTTQSCPGFAALSNSSRTPGTVNSTLLNGDGQVSVCNDACNVECAKNQTDAVEDDCYYLSDAIESLTPQSFTAPALSLTTFSFGAGCEYNYANFDKVDYSVCYADVGYVGAITANECSADSTGGSCVSTDANDNDWVVE
ncbi:uncharacterized protein LAESUDRAFT_759721 [Laetiporus sulphureus 93-53]|uniref:Uncharacterized protein n=1 Tax=Laetiporus sulphureus 93-53 TaxID=1314785 RepID=A0A165E3N1_9APHY|nr:uncharacterized protein LAESUDRAFT_759721 [Laetiporus sulphureus 93-53]KZT06190.1 hypothetical protein LAESUDRAFT_759721 [Laetiporus sulphureus 93-53]